MYHALVTSLIFSIFAVLILLLKPNLVFVLFALEIILLAANVNFISGSILLADFLGQTIALLLFALAALDTAVGLVLLLNYYNYRYSSTQQASETAPSKW